MAFALKMRHTPKVEIDAAVKRAAEILDITQYLSRKPKALSGGQRQRVAIGRAIVREPQVMLMDEPLSNLDAKLRNQMRAEIIKLRQRIDTTFIYVTHDQTEAMTLGVRPEHIIIDQSGVEAGIDVHEMMGSSIHLHVNALGQDVVLVVSTMDMTGSEVAALTSGANLRFGFSGHVCHIFNKETGINLEA